MNRLALGLAVAVGLFLYVRSPIDLIPDRVGVAGILDDLLALGIGAWWYWKRMPMLRATAGGSAGGASSGASSRSRSGTAPSGHFDPYQVLGVGRSASQDEIRQAYHDQLRQYHPDRVDDLGEELQKVAHERTLDIRRAYDELKRG